MVKIEKVENKDRVILEKMLQLYLHDISLYFTIEFDDKTGIYKYDDLDKYFTNESNYAYFIRYEGNIVGFVLIDIINKQNIIQEMFVLNNYKSKGIGKDAVINIFNQYRGNWIIRSLPNSSKAENFWNKTIKEYTNNKFEVEHVGKYNRAVFTFYN